MSTQLLLLLLLLPARKPRVQGLHAGLLQLLLLRPGGQWPATAQQLPAAVVHSGIHPNTRPEGAWSHQGGRLAACCPALTILGSQHLNQLQHMLPSLSCLSQRRCPMWSTVAQQQQGVGSCASQWVSPFTAYSNVVSDDVRGAEDRFQMLVEFMCYAGRLERRSRLDSQQLHDRAVQHSRTL
jgi:hypothetical protein